MTRSHKKNKTNHDSLHSTDREGDELYRGVEGVGGEICAGNTNDKEDAERRRDDIQRESEYHDT